MNTLKTILPLACLLVFILLSCEKQNAQPSSTSNTSPTTTGGTTTGGTTTGGTTTGGNSSYFTKDSLSGTKWTLYQYRDELNTNPLPRTDTLVFIDSDTYTWNGIEQAYQFGIQQNVYNKYVFTLHNTPFGSLRGFPPLTLKAYGEIINEPFSQSGASNPQTFFMWFKKVN